MSVANHQQITYWRERALSAEKDARYWKTRFWVAWGILKRVAIISPELDLSKEEAKQK